MDASAQVPAEGDEPGRLRELAGLFLRLGGTAYGGPPAHIALMQQEVVVRRRWLGQAEFLDLLGAANLIPGPNSTELAIHVGQRRAGRRGLVVAGVCFILPAFLIVLVLAWAYARWGRLPAVEGLLYGIKPVVVVVIVQALWQLARTAMKDRTLVSLAVAALATAWLGVPEVVVLLGSGGLAATVARRRAGGETLSAGWLATGGIGLAALPFSLPALFLYFLFVGSVLFGSGYVLVALLQSALVDRWGWLTQQQLLDAIAVGQVTPGPVFTTATFIGYLLGGLPGAILATVGIFLPGFFFVGLSAPVIPRLRQSRAAAAFLDGVNVAAVALILRVAVQLGQAALVDPLTGTIALSVGWLLFRRDVNSLWLILAGGLLGVLATVMRSLALG